MAAKRSSTSTIDREMKDSEFGKAYDREQGALEVSEFMAEKMAERKLSVRRLAAESGVSATVVQGIKSGKRRNIEYTTLRSLIRALGYRITFTKATTRKK